MEEPKMTEQESLELIAKVFDHNRRRMNFVRGELFIFWGVLIMLTAIAEYLLQRWTGSVQVLWSAFVPLICGYIYTVQNSRRRALVRTGFDDLLILIWGIPAMISVCSIAYALIMPENMTNPVGIMQLMLSSSLAITSEFFRGKGSRQSGSFVALNMLGFFGFITAFNITFRTPFDPTEGTWMFYLAADSVLLLILPGFILCHISKKQCSKS